MGSQSLARAHQQGKLAAAAIHNVNALAPIVGWIAQH